MRLLLALLFVFAPFTAHAHYVVWGDAEYRFHLSFSDLWKQQGGMPKDGRIQVLAPGGDDATCKVFAREDKRFTIYPRDYMTEVVAQEVNWDYWEQAVSNYDDLYFYYDNYGGLGAGDARYTLVDYIDTSGTEPVRKRAMVFASIYADLHMMVHCSAAIKNFEKYAADFGQVITSIQFEPRYARQYNGYYRDFLKKKEYGQHWFEPLFLFLIPRKEISAMFNCPRAEDRQACLSKLKPLPIHSR